MIPIQNPTRDPSGNPRPACRHCTRGRRLYPRGLCHACYFDPQVRALHPAEVRVHTRCPVVVGGERCGGNANHTGKHDWGRGD